jgi:hypothetical protein
MHAGELRAALIASNPVLVTRGADGELGGVSVELARALAAKLNIPVRLIPYENPARYNESLGKDEWDVALAARDPSRAEYLAFSDVFMEVDNGYVARPGLPLKSAEEVDRPGVKVAVSQGSAPDGFRRVHSRMRKLYAWPAGLCRRVTRWPRLALTYTARMSIWHTGLQTNSPGQPFSTGASMWCKCQSRLQRTIVLSFPQ